MLRIDSEDKHPMAATATTGAAPSVASAPAPRLQLGRAEIALILVTMVWGATFLIIKHALVASGPLFFVGLRFAAATLVTGALFLPALRGMTRRDLFAGSAIGLFIYLGYTLQTYGLQTIDSSKSAFITALYVPLVPMLQWAVLRKRPHLMSWIGVIFAFVGLILLAGPGGTDIGPGHGELLTIISTMAIAAEIILISLFAGKVDVRRVTVVQLGVTSLLAFATMAPMGEVAPGFSWLLLASAIGLGLASGIIQFTMNWAQKTVSPTRATVIYAGEPVWAGIVGRIAGERLPAAALLGGLLMVIGVLVSELRFPGKKQAEG